MSDWLIIILSFIAVDHLGIIYNEYWNIIEFRSL